MQIQPSECPGCDEVKPNTQREEVKVKRFFTTAGIDPLDEVDWTKRTASIKDAEGKIVFEQPNVEVPSSWSVLATNVVASKYFRGQKGSPDRESSVRSLITRVVETITRWGMNGGYLRTTENVQAFRAELTHLLVRQKMSFNSPVWFNLGAVSDPQVSACQPYHALVSTPGGFVPIGKIVEGNRVGMEVMDANGVTPVVAVKSNGEKEVFRITLRNGSFVEATGDHVVRVAADRRQAPTWMKVADVKPGMRMHLYPHRAHERGEVEVHPSEAALAGWLVSDGFVGQYEHGTNQSLIVEFVTVNDDEFEYVRSHLDNVFPNVEWNVIEEETQDKTLRFRRLRAHGERFREFVTRFGLLDRGIHANVPAVMFSAQPKAVEAYLRSVFQSDGYVTITNDHRAAHVALSRISRTFIEGVQLLLQRLGIFSRVRRKEEHRSDRHDGWECDIGIRSEREAFAQRVGFVSARKRDLLERACLIEGKTSPYLREESVVSIESVGVTPVYDIQTASGEYLSNNVAVHNCFINSVDDTMDSIMELAATEARLFKQGSGAGSNLSKIRASCEPLSAGGMASGPVSFMRGFDSFAGVIKSGGRTRRAAKMVILDADHPDIEEFVTCKAEEERRAHILIEAGVESAFNAPHSAYESVGFQNANHSVRVTDEFMRLVEADTPESPGGLDWNLIARKTGKTVAVTGARSLFRQIAAAAWQCGDPGMQFDTTVNDWNPCIASDRIYASNPCSEFMFLDNTACNLASLNLMQFRRLDGAFDAEAFRHAVRTTLLAQEIMVSFASYPTKRITEMSERFRPLGLGYANLGALLMSKGLPYDSADGRALAAAITSLMSAEAYSMSADMAAVMKPFADYEKNRVPMNHVIQKHAQASTAISGEGVTLREAKNLAMTATRAWETALAKCAEHGVRNSQVTLLAPTGTIGFMMDVDTTGIEPDIALVKTKKLVGGGSVKIANQSVPLALRALGYTATEIDTIIGHLHTAGELPDAVAFAHRNVFATSLGNNAIHWRGHVRMMAAVQPFLSGAISKTVNMPNESTVEEVEAAYMMAWKMGLKSIAIYRDGCKKSQPLNVSTTTAKALASVAAVESGVSPRPIDVRRRLPDERPSITHKFSIADHEGYMTIGLYDDGSPGEVFIRMSKEGSTVAGLMDTLATTVSMALQYGVPLRAFVDKFSHVRFEPSGFSKDDRIGYAKSIVDYIFRWLGVRFLGDAAAHEPQSGGGGSDHGPSVSVQQSTLTDAPPCSTCGAIMQRNGACHRCPNCGATSGCS